MKHSIKGYLLAMIILFAGWHIGSIWLNKSFLPTPWQAFAAFIQLCFDGEMGKQFLISGYRIIAGIFFALVLALPCGLLMGRNQKFDGIMRPLMYLLYPLPKVVFLPIIVVLMGLGNQPKIFLISLVVFFQIVVVTRDAAKNIPMAYMTSIQSLNANTWQTYRHVIVPYCLPKIMTSLRVTLGTAIAILFFAETFASFDGLGYFIQEGMETRDYPAMYAGIIGMAVLGVLLYWVMDLAEHYWCRWQKY